MHARASAVMYIEGKRKEEKEKKNIHAPCELMLAYECKGAYVVCVRGGYIRSSHFVSACYSSFLLQPSS